MNKSNKLGVIGGGIIGAALGVAAGLALAPESGKKFRADVKKEGVKAVKAISNITPKYKIKDLKSLIKKTTGIVTVLLLTLMSVYSNSTQVLASNTATVDLGTSANYVILSKAGVSTTGTTAVKGNIGLSPAAASYITGFGLILPTASAFSTSAQVTGNIYASNYTNPTQQNLSTAVLDMQTAFTNAMGRAPDFNELGAGNIGGLTLAPGVYKWGTSVLIPTDVTLSGSANDVWIFKIAQSLNLSSGAKVILAGGAKANNVFWVVAGQTTIGTTAVINGNILDQTAIVLNTGAVLNGRALAQTAVTLDSNTVTIPDSTTSVTPVVPAMPATPTPSTNNQNPTVPATPASASSNSNSNSQSSTQNACTMEAMLCSSDGSYVSRHGPNCAFDACPSEATMNALRAQLNGLVIALQSMQTTRGQIPMGQMLKMVRADLVEGNRNEDVKTLQEFLISNDHGGRAQALARVGATSYFGPLTRSALAEYQSSVGVNPALGNFGPITRAHINAKF